MSTYLEELTDTVLKMKHIFYTDCYVTISLHKLVNCFMKIQKLTYQYFSRKKTKESKARPPMTSDTQALNNKVPNKLIPVKPT